jgi:hypothetical protein
MNATVNNETCAIEFHVIAGNGKPLLGRKSVNCMRKSNYVFDIRHWESFFLYCFISASHIDTNTDVWGHIRTDLQV